MTEFAQAGARAQLVPPGSLAYPEARVEATVTGPGREMVLSALAITLSSLRATVGYYLNGVSDWALTSRSPEAPAGEGRDEPHPAPEGGHFTVRWESDYLALSYDRNEWIYAERTTLNRVFYLIVRPGRLIEVVNSEQDAVHLRARTQGRDAHDERVLDDLLAAPSARERRRLTELLVAGQAVERHWSLATTREEIEAAMVRTGRRGHSEGHLDPQPDAGRPRVDLFLFVW